MVDKTFIWYSMYIVLKFRYSAFVSVIASKYFWLLHFKTGRLFAVSSLALCPYVLD